MRRGFLLICLIVGFTAMALAQNQQLGFRMSNKQRKIKIPFELHNNLIVVPVILNKTLPLKFVLDTGVRTAILVDKNFSDILDLKYSKKYVISGVGEYKRIEAYVTNNVSLTLPGVHGEGHAMLVLEKDLMELKNYLGTDVHGILGYELFSRFIIKINYSTHMLTLYDPESFRVPKRYQAIPMTIEDTKPHIYVNLLQDDGSEREVKLMVDSGASQSIFLELDSDSMNLKIPDKNIYSYMGRGLGGPIIGHIGRVPEITIGNYTLEDVVVNYPKTDSYVDSLEQIRTHRNGTMGGEILSRFNVIFNFPGQKLHIKKNSYFKKDFTYNLSGLTIKAEGPGFTIFEVSEVRNNSAGDLAGVQVGDTIIKIDDHQCKNLNLSQMVGILNSRAGKKVRMTLKRKDQLVDIVIQLKSLI